MWSGNSFLIVNNFAALKRHQDGLPLGWLRVCSAVLEITAARTQAGESWGLTVPVAGCRCIQRGPVSIARLWCWAPPESPGTLFNVYCVVFWENFGDSETGVGEQLHLAMWLRCCLGPTSHTRVATELECWFGPWFQPCTLGASARGSGSWVSDTCSLRPLLSASGWASPGHWCRLPGRANLPGKDFSLPVSVCVFLPLRYTKQTTLWFFLKSSCVCVWVCQFPCLCQDSVNLFPWSS